MPIVGMRQPHRRIRTNDLPSWPSSGNLLQRPQTATLGRSNPAKVHIRPKCKLGRVAAMYVQGSGLKVVAPSV